MIRLGSESDLEFLSEHEHISPERLEDKIDSGQVYIYLADRSPVGWLRFSYFWDLIPFMDMLFVLEERRGRGIGRDLVLQWESDMFQSGADLVLTSTQVDEKAQHFYRKLGYRDCGALFLPIQLPAEIFLCKTRPTIPGGRSMQAS